MMTRVKRTAFLLINLVAATVLRAEVSTTPPPAYEASIRALLTPLEELSARKDPHAGNDEPGTVRLAEQVTRVEEDGTYLRAVHHVVQPYSAKGADAAANDRYRFYSRQETVHLVLARTVLPDGTSKPLGPNAAFLQKGNRFSASTYDDAQDLVIVFPDVKPGVLCEAIVVYERKEPPVKGGYSNVLDWSPGWPVGETRYVLDFPATWKDKVKDHPVAVKDVKTAELPAPEGRLRCEWKRGAAGRPPYEPNPAPASQVGPATWIGTFADWDEMAAWYQGLLTGQDVLDDELKAKVAEWTAEAKSPREILDILFDRVANDIRYEGLEFGVSGLQPYACGTVWKNQYGDCKDKANLLVAMLRHRGVPAKLVLVNTDDAGIVHRRIPDFRHFNHAITVVELPVEGGGVEQVFCDATIRHGRPGLLAPTSAGRDVLAIDGGKAQWLKTPEVEAGEDSYRFDLALDEEGRLTGWLSITSKGYYAVRLAHGYAGADRETARDRLTGLVEEFFDGAEVVDVVLPAEQRVAEEVTVKAYFTGPARQRDQGGRLSLPFPSSPMLFNDYGDTQVRTSSYFQWRDRMRVEATVRLPGGWRPESLPPPLKLDTPAYLAEASWSHGAGVCTANLRLDCRQSVIPAEAVAAPAQANRSLAAWVGVPLLLTQAEGKAPDKPSMPAGQVELPLMPTGQGQMNLVDRMFPAGSDSNKRRAALQKVLSYFPNDPATVHDARVQIAYLRVLEENYPAAVEELAPLAARRPEGVDAESFAFSRYLHAVALHETDAKETGIKILRELAADESLSDYRRGWAARFAGEWLVESKPVPKEALDLLKQSVALGGDAGGHALVALVPAMISAGEGEALAEMLAKGDELDSFGDDAAAVLKKLADAATEKAGELLPWLTRARDLAEDEERKKQLATAAAALESWASRGEAYATVRARVLEILEKRGASYLDGTKPGETAAATEASLDALYGKDRKKWTALAAAYLRAFEPTPQFSRIVWQMLCYFNIADGKDDTAIFDELAAITASLPKSDDHYWECRFTYSWKLRDTGKLKEAEAIHRSLTEDPGLPPDFVKAAWAALGESQELQGRWKDAAASYAKFKEDRHGYQVVAEGLLRAGLLLAHAGEREEALAMWKLLADVPATTYDDSLLRLEITEAVVLAADEKAALEQWQRMDGWWKDSFLPLLKTLGLEDASQLRPYLQDQGVDLDARCRKAVTDKDVAVVAKDFARVALSFRWLPCQIRSLQGVLNSYVRPLRPNTLSAQGRLLEDAAAAVAIATPSVTGHCLRLHTALAVDRGEPKVALKLLDGQWQEAPGRDEEHRERAGYIFALAAANTGERLPDALGITEVVIGNPPGFVNPGAWLSLHAELLAKSGKQAEAIVFLKEKAADPSIKSDATALSSVNSKLDSLTQASGRDEGLEKSVSTFITKFAPRWYPHVGPADLDDPRVGDPNTILTGDLARFHPAEQMRLRLLIALSDRATPEVRERAYGDALVNASEHCRTWPEAFAIFSHVLDDEGLPLSLRLPFLWKAAVLATTAGRGDVVKKLSEKPVFGSYNELYAKRYYPLLQDIANANGGDISARQAVLGRLTGREIDGIELQLGGMFHAFLLAAGDVDAAVAAREGMKSWKLAPGSPGSLLSSRLAWLRMENTAKPAIEFDRALRKIYLPVVERIAKDAPAGWEERIELTHLEDLTCRQALGVRAARMLAKSGMDVTEGPRWLRYPSFWFAPGGEIDHPKALEFFKVALGIKDDLRANLALSCTLLEMKPPADGSWKELDAVLDGGLKADKREATAAMVAFWRAFRDFKPGGPVDVLLSVAQAKKMSMLGIAAYGNAMEALVVNGDKAGLDSLLAAINPDDFLSSAGIGVYATALEMLGREDELELVRESVAEVIRGEMMTAWFEGSVSSARRALELAVKFDRADLLPAVWRKDVTTLTADPLDSALMTARLARLDRDWQGVLDALAKVKDLAKDDETGWHYLSAEAHVSLGKPDLARPHLDTVIRAGILHGSSFMKAALLLKSLDQPAK